MTQMVWCNVCKSNVIPEKPQFDWQTMYFFNTLYLIYHWFFQKTECPICHKRDFSPMKSKDDERDYWDKDAPLFPP